MFRRVILFGICILILLNSCAVAETFSPQHVSSTGYTQTQWLTNDNSRALFVCMAANDYCSANGIGFANVVSLLVSGKSYIREEEGCLGVYIPDGDSCLCIKIRFGTAAKSASASQKSIGDIDTGSGNWYTVSPESCAVILAG